MARAIDVTFSMSSNATAWEPALGILAGTGTQLLPMVDVFPLRDWQDAFAAVENKSRIKILLDPNGN